MVVHWIQVAGIVRGRQLILVPGLHQVDPDAVVEQPSTIKIQRLRPLHLHEPEHAPVEIPRLVHLPAQPRDMVQRHQRRHLLLPLLLLLLKMTTIFSSSSPSIFSIDVAWVPTFSINSSIHGFGSSSLHQRLLSLLLFLLLYYISLADIVFSRKYGLGLKRWSAVEGKMTRYGSWARCLNPCVTDIFLIYFFG